MNKKGWLRILESFIGITLLVGIIIFIYSNNPDNSVSSDIITITQSKILDKIESNNTLRLAVLQNNLIPINESAKLDIPPNFDFEIMICDIANANCKASYRPQQSYVKDKIIASNLTLYSPKKVRLFLWEK